MQVEADLQLSRLLAGLHGADARKEVSEIASNVMEAGVQMTLLDDRLIAMMEAAQVDPKTLLAFSANNASLEYHAVCVFCRPVYVRSRDSPSKEYSQEFQVLKKIRIRRLEIQVEGKKRDLNKESVDGISAIL